MTETTNSVGRKNAPRAKNPARKNPAASEGLRRFWNDPDRVAKWKRTHVRQMAERQADPEKSWSRRGIPDGMRREQAEAMWAKASQSAKQTLRSLSAQGLLEANLDPHAEEALEAALTVMYSAHNQRTRVAAARIVLTFTVGAPPRRKALTLEKAEEWLRRFAPAIDNVA